MYVHGQFVNQKGDIVEVRILTNNDNTTTREIGTKESGIYFTDDPIEITDEVNDVFDVLLSQSATISLLVADFVPDFFQMNVLDAKVVILCGNKIVFAGYIEPQTYSQDFNEMYDELQLTCIDALSALQYAQYKGVTNSANYTTAKCAAEQVTFRALLCDILNSVGEGIFIAEDGESSGKPNVYYDGTVKTSTYTEVFANTSINELLFFDDDEDSIWTYEDVLTEMLRFLNLHIRQIGCSFYIFDWATCKDNTMAGDYWYQLNVADDVATSQEHAASAKTITLVGSNVEDDDTQISVEDAYNQIQVNCDRAEIDELAISPLDEDSLVAPFPRRTLYCRELVAYPDDNDDYSYNKWTGHMQPRLAQMYNGEWMTDLDKFIIRDYYVQIYRSKYWTFRCYGYGDAYSSKDVYDVEDWMKDEHALLDNVSCSPEEGLWPYIVPCIVKVSKSDKKHSINEEITKFDDETTYIVIPVRGYDYYYSVTSADTWTVMNERCRGIEEMGGLIRCNAMSAGGSLAPSDDETTNYIVIEGKVLMQETSYSSYESYYGNNSPHKGSLPEHRLFTTFNDPNQLPGNIRSFDDRGRWLSVDGSDVNILRTMHWFDPQGNRRDFDHYKFCFYPPLDAQKYLTFSYNENHDDWDTIDKVPVLDCMLKVGNKYCVETFEDYTDSTGHKRTKSIMQWLTEEQCPTYTYTDYTGTKKTYTKKTFSIGIDPEPGKRIIGETYDIANTLSVTDNIDAEGTAIPIKASDRLSGKVEFSIIGPSNGAWNEVYYRQIIGFDIWRDNTRSVLDNCSAIYLSDFKIGVYSDNGKVTNGEDKDLIYMSDEDAAYRNIKECDDLKINSALTSEECIALGVANQVCLSNPSNADGSALLSVYNKNHNTTAKPEQFYVDAYYNECHKPKIKMEQNMQDKGCTLSMFDTYVHPALPNKKFFIQGAGRNLMEGSLKLTLREI